MFTLVVSLAYIASVISMVLMHARASRKMDRFYRSAVDALAIEFHRARSGLSDELALRGISVPPGTTPEDWAITTIDALLDRVLVLEDKCTT